LNWSYYRDHCGFLKQEVIIQQPPQFKKEKLILPLSEAQGY